MCVPEDTLTLIYSSFVTSSIHNSAMNLFVYNTPFCQSLAWPISANFNPINW
jgi:hypothetical protein